MKSTRRPRSWSLDKKRWKDNMSKNNQGIMLLFNRLGKTTLPNRPSMTNKSRNTSRLKIPSPTKRSLVLKWRGARMLESMSIREVADEVEWRWRSFRLLHLAVNPLLVEFYVLRSKEKVIFSKWSWFCAYLLKLQLHEITPHKKTFN